MKARTLIIGIVAVALLGAAGCRVNPVTGGRELMLVPEEQELALGHQVHPDIVFMYDGEYRDPELHRYLGTIVMRLHEVSHRPQIPMQFTILNTSVLNAFATPGHVYATRGFLARLENEAQFAAVMGHELAHVTAGHSARRLSDSILVSLATGVADMAVGDAMAARVALGAGQVGVALLGLSYSREQERQADRVGTYYMALAGWDAQQAIAMQELLHSFAEREPTRLEHFLSTHPPADDRVDEIQAVIEEMDLGPHHVQGDGVFAERWNRRLRRLREVDAAFEPYDRGMKLLTEENHSGALEAANRAIANRSDQPPFFRLKGDALLGLGRTGEAKDAYRQALQVHPRYAPANIGLGQAYLAEGNHAAAEREFEKATQAYPGALSAHWGLAKARFNQGRHQDAIEPLRRVTSAVPNAPEPHYMLAVCYDRLGRRADAYASYRNALAAGLSGDERARAESRVQSLAPAE